MCGITVRVGDGDAVRDLLGGLENLEYRGYDSAGIAIQNDVGIDVVKREGTLDRLREAVDEDALHGAVGIGHTRWSTHGPPTDENAHPHTDCSGEIAVVHNGIIENYRELRNRLRDGGHVFTSETDTEVIPHLVESHLDAGMHPEAAFRAAVDALDGSYAVAAIVGGTDAVFAARNGSPLVLGVGKDRYFLASDAPAFLEHTARVVYLQDGDVVRVNREGYTVTDADGNRRERSVETIDWSAEDVGKAGYDHYMLKEIHEQPAALRQTIRGRVDSFTGDVDLEAVPPGTYDDVERVHLVAMGTSAHAAMYAEALLTEYGVDAGAYLAGEYATSPPPADPNTLVIAVSQSGETADTLSAVRRVHGTDVQTLAVTNVVGSSLTRECDQSLFIRAGPEIGVAATKTFSSQVVTLSLLAERLVRDVRGSSMQGVGTFLEALSAVPGDVQRVLDESSARSVAETYLDSEAFFFIGRNTCYPVALEGALKFKEITYEHAEGFAASELKHGPLALVTEDTPVFALFTGTGDDTKTLSNVKEIQARGAPVIAIAPDDSREVREQADHVLSTPDTHPEVAGVLANVQLQLVAYHAADSLDRPIDKPRNLAKSVTVE
jgi:glucosamine--fructose-6-phosphate aminotransferase (isomerizing)